MTVLKSCNLCQAHVASFLVDCPASTWHLSFTFIIFTHILPHLVCMYMQVLLYIVCMPQCIYMICICKVDRMINKYVYGCRYSRLSYYSEVPICQWYKEYTYIPLLKPKTKDPSGSEFFPSLNSGLIPSLCVCCRVSEFVLVQWGLCLRIPLWN